MKCLFVVRDLARAGAEKQATLLACGLKDLGWSVSIVVIKERNDFAEPLAAAAIPVTFLHRRGPLDLHVVARLRNAIRKFEPDVVLSLLFLANLLIVLASRGLRPRPNLVVSVRESYLKGLPRSHRMVARLVHRRADLTLFNAQSVLREEATGVLEAGRTAYLPNAVSIARADPIDWREWGIVTGPVVLSVGQLAPVKGHRMLIEAFAAVHAANPGARLVLVGDGPEEGRLRAVAEAGGLSDRITFLGHHKDPLPFIAAADVFVQPSLSEGMSNALMEAMALGRCIVATRVGAASDLLEDGVQALLPQPAVRELRAAIQRALGDPALRTRLGDSARERSQDFSVDRIASELSSILTDVVQRRPPGP